MAEGNSSSSAGGGIGLGGVLFVVFLVLKLCGVIDWSWWLVTAPLWGSFALAMVLIGFVFVVDSFSTSHRGW